MGGRPISLWAVWAAAALAAAVPALTTRAATHAAPSSPPSAARELTLGTGQEVVEQPGPGGRLQMNEIGGPETPLLTYRINGDAVAMPVADARFVGGVLDPALFDLTALAQAESADPAAVPVQVSWHGSTEPSMPWLTNQRSAGRQLADGDITGASGGALQSALADGSLGAVTHIALLGGSVPPVTGSPDFQMYTEAVHGIGVDGRPDTGDVSIIVNVDNIQKFAALEFWYHGLFKISVPAGHYCAVSIFTSTNSSGMPVGINMVVTEFTVTGAGSVTVDARSATSTVTVTTPRPVSSGSGTVLLQRGDATGFGISTVGAGWFLGDGFPPFAVRVSPVPAPRVGTQGWITSFHLESAPSSSPYSYDLQFGNVGAIPRDEHEVATASRLATVLTSYATDVRGRQTLEFRSGFFPSQVFNSTTSMPFAAPLQRTEYVSAAPDLMWLQTVIDDVQIFGGIFDASPQVFSPGQHLTATWNKGPSGPGVQVNTGSALPLEVCPACEDGAGLQFVIYPHGDNPPGHWSQPEFPQPGVTENDSFTLTRDGSVIASGTDPLGVIIPISSNHGLYQLRYAVSLHAPWWTLSTSTVTTWTFTLPQAAQSPLPPDWVCLDGSIQGCNILALMIPDYELPLSLTNTIAPGPVTWQLGVQHILAASIAVTGASVSVSFDGGSRWQSASVGRTSSGFSVSYSDPSSASGVDLRIHVTDSNGSVLDQTIDNAYAIS